MLLEDVKPFVRQAIISTISSSTKNDVFFELQSPDCRLFHIISGNGNMIIHNKSYKLCSGCSILFKAGTKYIWQPSDDGAIEYITINFDYTQKFSHIKKPFHPVHSNKFSKEDVLENVDIQDATVLNSPIVLYNSNSTESRLRLLTTEFNVADKSYLDILLSTVLKSVIISMVRELSFNKEDCGNANMTLTRNIIQYIQNNYDKEITYEILGEKFFMNPVYINRVFKKNSGFSLHSFLINYRINMAMELLRTTSIPVKDIAISVGFTDVPHFIKTFKKNTGSSPGKYRNLAEY